MTRLTLDDALNHAATNAAESSWSRLAGAGAAATDLKIAVWTEQANYLTQRGRLMKYIPQRVKDIFAKYGASNCHMYLPGVGSNVQDFNPGNYQDSSGTTAAVVDGPVGLVLDAAGGVGSELVVNGDFSNGITGWNNTSIGTGSATVSSSQLSIYRLDNSNKGGVNQAVGTAGKSYRVQFKVVSGTAFVSLAGNGGNYGAGSYSIVWVASGTGFYIECPGNASTCVLDNVSIKEITGIHASQSTAGYKPVERKGIVNLLLNSSAPATQTVSLAVGTYTLSLIGTGSVVITGLGAGTLTGTGASDLVTLTFSVAVAGSVIFTKSGSVTSFGLFQGTLTAAQILYYGGIPLTTTAAASSALGNPWLDYDDVDDKLVLTIPAGYESATIIKGSKTAVTTLHSQNLVGTLNLNTDMTICYIFKNQPSATEMVILENFATSRLL